MSKNTILLQGIVGSHAYGIAHEGSDVDRLGVFAAPTLEVAGFDWSAKKETRHTTDPDFTAHEVGKFLRLALKCNPTITELLWLDDYEIANEWGVALVSARRMLLSNRAVRDAYLGYATAQARKLEQRGDSFSSDTRKRTAKHGKHMLRLLRQARQLATEGWLTVKVDDPELYHNFDSMDVPEMLAVFHREEHITREAFERSVLPAQPDRQQVSRILRGIRERYMR